MNFKKYTLAFLMCCMGCGQASAYVAPSQLIAILGAIVSMVVIDGVYPQSKPVEKQKIVNLQNEKPTGVIKSSREGEQRKVQQLEKEKNLSAENSSKKKNNFFSR